MPNSTILRGYSSTDSKFEPVYTDGSNRLLVSTVGSAATPVTALVPNGTQADQALVIDATAGGVQFSAFHADTTHVEFDVQTAQIRFTLDNSAPTSTNGHILEAGDFVLWPKAKATAAKFIRTGATSAVIHVSQLKGA